MNKIITWFRSLFCPVFVRVSTALFCYDTVKVRPSTRIQRVLRLSGASGLPAGSLCILDGMLAHPDRTLFSLGITDGKHYLTVIPGSEDYYDKNKSMVSCNR